MPKPWQPGTENVPDGFDGDPRPGTKAWLDEYDANYQDRVPGYIKPSLRSREQEAAFARGLGKRKSFGRAVGRFNMLRELNPTYSQPEEQLRGHALGELDRLDGPGDVVDLRRDGVDYQKGGRPMLGRLEGYAQSHLGTAAINDSPMLAQLSKYTRERLGTGLTAEETAALRGQNLEAVESSASEASRTMANTAAASGLDPRAATAAMARVQNERMQGRAGVERFMTAQELARKRDMETLGMNVSQAELQRLGQAEQFAQGIGALGEQARQFDVGTAESGRRFDVEADTTRRNQIEAQAMALAQLAEGRREYDMGFIEARRQARRARELAKAQARAAEPTGLEKASAILGGIRGGMSMGG